LPYLLQKAPKPDLAYSGNQQATFPCSGNTVNIHPSAAVPTESIVVTTVNLKSAEAYLITHNTIHTSNVSDKKKASDED